VPTFRSFGPAVGRAGQMQIWVGAERPFASGGTSLSSFWFPSLQTTSAAGASG